MKERKLKNLANSSFEPQLPPVRLSKAIQSARRIRKRHRGAPLACLLGCLSLRERERESDSRERKERRKKKSTSTKQTTPCLSLSLSPHTPTSVSLSKARQECRRYSIFFSTMLQGFWGCGKWLKKKCGWKKMIECSNFLLLLDKGDPKKERKEIKTEMKAQRMRKKARRPWKAQGKKWQGKKVGG